ASDIGTGTILDVAASTALNADTSVAGGNILIDSITDLLVGLVNAGTGDVTITAIQGAIDDASDDTTVDIIADVLTLTARDEIGVDPTSGFTNTAIETTVASLDASSTTAGDIVITETDGITLTDVDTANGAITINTGNATIVTDVAASGSGDEDDVAITATSGDITIDVVSAAGSGDVTIEATAGSINETDAGDADVDITADALTLTARDEIGGAGELDIETTVASLDASSTTAGDIVITETDGLTLTDVDTVASDITITSNTGNITLADIDEVVSAGSGGSVVLSALTGSITVAADSAYTEIKTSGSVTLTGAAIGGTNPLDIEDATSLTINDLDGSTNDIQIREQSASTIASTTIIVPTATSGDIDITYFNTDSVNIDNGHVLNVVDLDQGVSSFSYTADTGDITIGAVNTGTNAASITATAGSINDDADDTIVDIAGGVVTLTARDEIGGSPVAGKTTDVSGAIETAVASLDASSTNDGDIVITETDGIILTDVDTADGAITISAGGKITATDVAAGDAGDDERHDVTLTATTDGMVLTSVVADDDIICTAKAGDMEVQNSLGAADRGGVSLISDNGWIYTTGDPLNPTVDVPVLDVPITGYSDDIVPTGVDLPFGSGQKAAIVVSSNEELKLGPDAVMTAKGNYYTSDDRESVNFKYEGPDSGVPIDVAIYLRSVSSNVDVDSSKIDIDITSVGIGTLVVDAYDTVTFGNNFETYLQSVDSTIKRIEVCSRISETSEWAESGADPNGNPRSDHGFNLPYADNPDNVIGLWTNFGLEPGSAYVLRGEDGGVIDFAWVLRKTESVPLVLPMPLEPEDQGQVKIERRDAEVLGLPDKPELARAYPPSLNTDLNLDKAAQILYALVPILRDSDRIATLNRIVVELWQDAEQPIAPEQEAVIAQRIGASTAGPWVAALTEYADVLRTMVGRSETDSVLFVMRTYVIPLAEQGLIQDQTVAFVEMQIEGLGG
ncbi:MAG: hypothetical protein WAV28_17275, partial [Sedimentisphaerales bacterium]